MKIVQLATSLSGGAGIAALRIHRSVESVGVNSEIFANGKNHFQRENDSIISNSYFDALRSRAVTILQARYFQNSNDLVTTFSINRVNLDNLVQQKPDLVHIHSTYNLLNFNTLRKLSEKSIPLLVTLHDQRIFTAGCHYSRDCFGFKDSCEKCPQVTKFFQSTVAKQFTSQLHRFAGIQNIHFVTPSLWLANLASQSKLLGGQNINVIRNPIPDVYPSSIKEKEKIRSTEKVVLGFVSVDLHNPYKGLNVLIEALRILSARNTVHNFRVHLIGRGSKEEVESLVDTKQFFAHSDSEMVEALREIDYLVVPSNSDNLPSVVGEALMSGRRVIGSNAGGIPEVLGLVAGDIFSSDDPAQLANILERKLHGDSKPVEIDKVKPLFSMQSIGTQYKRRYEEIIGR